MCTVIDYESIILDSNQVKQSMRSSINDFSSSICGNIWLPSYECAQFVASRCSTVRSIIEVWGEGAALEEVLESAWNNHKSVISPIFPRRSESELWMNSWRVHFRRYGRSGKSGLDYEGKKELLKVFTPLLHSLNGKVDLINAVHHLVYLEDWCDYHTIRNAVVAADKAARNFARVETQEKQYPITPDELESAISFSPHRAMLGRIIAEGPSIQVQFDLKKRPFLGTTTMNAVAAHLTAVAALIEPEDLVLDPFCGTCGLLVAAAHLGAEVVGSDIDEDSLFPSKAKNASKNGRFKRKDGTLQFDRTPADNFRFYGFPHLLVDLFAADVTDWLHFFDTADEDTNKTLIKKYKMVNIFSIRALYDKSICHFHQFDAIICDPPFGIREKMPATTTVETSSSNELLPLEQQVASLDVLLRVAALRLRPACCPIPASEDGAELSSHGKAGRLVFWLPTVAHVQPQEVIKAIETLIKVNTAPSFPAGLPLRVVRVGPEELNDNLWRWLCVLERVESSISEQCNSQ